MADGLWLMANGSMANGQALADSATFPGIIQQMRPHFVGATLE
jgi:hypothetical protein